jgi:Na+/proline symporter
MLQIRDGLLPFMLQMAPLQIVAGSAIVWCLFPISHGAGCWLTTMVTHGITPAGLHNPEPEK